MSPKETTKKVIRILIADDHALVAESLAMMLNSEESFEVVKTVSNGWQAYNYVTSHDVDVVLADYHMPLLNGIELCVKLKEVNSTAKCIMLTMSEDADHIRESVQAGVYGYVMKVAGREELIKAVSQVAEGEKYFSERIVKKLAEIPDIESPTGKARIEDISMLTKREIEVLKHIVKDLSNIQIASEMGISLTTVETHRRNLMKKVGVGSAIGLMRWGLKNGVVDRKDI